MKQDSVRTTIDIPAPLYKQLKEQAAASGKSIRELIIARASQVVSEQQANKPRKARRVKFPLIDSEGPPIDLTNEQIYEFIEFP